MQSPKTPNSTDPTEHVAKATGERMPIVVRIALVATLAGCALVDLALQTNPAANRYPAELAGTPVDSPNAENDEGDAPLAHLSLLATEYRAPAPSTARAGTHEHRAIHVEHLDEIRQASAATEYYFPAQFNNQARSNDGNVMTYEHD